MLQVIEEAGDLTGQAADLNGRAVKVAEDRSGVSCNTIWRLEDGRQGPHPRTLRKLAEALGVEPSELVKGEGRG